MYATGRGLPSWRSVLAVLVGGFLMAGGANAINMWFDRDIDDVMGRTRLRPIPAGRMPATHALRFGIGLGAVAFLVLWRFANLYAALLALAGLLFYVGVYTMWLKRSSPQNIVIGGAAGAIPPLVGYAAATGGLDLAAAYLFAIIFFWTPPHFWALALMKRGDYARARVPMLPVVAGDRTTKVQMLVYTLMLLPLTLMPSLFGAFGPVYFVAAALLGARLLWYCLRLLREGEGPTGTPWRMYRYSLLYLALLFVAMGVDKALPIRSPLDRPELIVLDRPDAAGPDDHSHHAP
jgi:protoheme IX farnesyltransferase